MGTPKRTPSGSTDPVTKLNVRQEKFCRNLTAGMSRGEAYEQAGYDVGLNTGLMYKDRDDRNSVRKTAEILAGKLLRNPKIKDRLLDLQREKMENIDRMRTNMAERWKFDIEKTTKLLLEDRHFARTGQLTLPEDGVVKLDVSEIPPDWRPDARAAVQATMGIAKLHGLLVDRKEVTVIDAMRDMNNDELITFIAKLQAQVGPVIDVPVESARFTRKITTEDVEPQPAEDDEDPEEDPEDMEFEDGDEYRG